MLVVFGFDIPLQLVLLSFFFLHNKRCCLLFMFRKQSWVAKVYLDELISFLLEPNKDREEVSMCKQHFSQYSLCLT
jgi:hypothetical protein